MLFRDAVHATAGLANACQPGLRALESVDRGRVRCSRSRTLAGSVNLDKALSASYPDAPRWDYGIGIHTSRASDRAIWVEVHPASSHHVQEELDKLGWLRHWLASSAKPLARITDGFVWVASGRVAIQPGSPQRKLLSARGVRFAGSRLIL